MPVYNEDPSDVFARLEAIGGSLLASGASGFDVFVLSDTRDEAVLVREAAEFAALRRRWRFDGGRLYYRRRPENVGRKAGNIAEWVRRFGAAYGSMVVLDADSLMDGETLLRLAAAMERNPSLGLLQTVPQIVRGSSLFARLQQFASRLYGPLLSEGLAWWCGAEGNYWGHNAIIRVRAFADHAGLPRLPGRKPFGGEILSHDFVEAALLRRAGWAVRMTPQLTQSYEECPQSLSDMIVRERRWCQGNLQHSAIVAARGLHWTSRVHLLRGISSYLMAPLWLAFVTATTLQAVSAGGAEASRWALPSLRVLSWVFVVTIGTLLGPKLLSFGLACARPAERRAWGDFRTFVKSFLLEAVLSSLIAPILMMAQVQAFFDVLLGRDSGWKPQRRDAEGVSWRAAAKQYWPYAAAGATAPLLAYLISPPAFLSVLPVVGGLALSIPLEVITASPQVGAWLSARGLLVTPEEREPPEIIRRFNALRRPAVERAEARRTAALEPPGQLQPSP
jgi:membrane glycosyltransferase